MDYSTEQEFKKVYRQLKCKANCSTLCDNIYNCLGISADGSDSLFLNQQGDWVSAGGVGSGWSLTGNAGTNPATNFVGTTDAQAFLIKTNSTQITLLDTNGSCAIGSAIAGLGAAAPIASGQNSFALGAGTTASGIVSFVGGINSTSSGIASFAYGANNSASSTGSFAFGNACDNSGTNSITLGETLLNTNNSAAVFGQNNEDAANMIFAVGIGADSSNRANAITILNTGEVGIGTNTPSTLLDVVGSITANTLVLTSVPAYADNTAAFAAIGANKLYYTDVAGEYILKLSH